MSITAICISSLEAATLPTQVAEIVAAYASPTCDYRRCSGENPSHRCAKCKQNRYCNRQCQLNAWKAGHKQHCSHLQKLPSLSDVTFPLSLDKKCGAASEGDLQTYRLQFDDYIWEKNAECVVCGGRNHATCPEVEEDFTPPIVKGGLGLEWLEERLAGSGASTSKREVVFTLEPETKDIFPCPVPTVNGLIGPEFEGRECGLFNSNDYRVVRKGLTLLGLFQLLSHALHVPLACVRLVLPLNSLDQWPQKAIQSKKSKNKWQQKCSPGSSLTVDYLDALRSGKNWVFKPCSFSPCGRFLGGRCDNDYMCHYPHVLRSTFSPGEREAALVKEDRAERMFSHSRGVIYTDWPRHDNQVGEPFGHSDSDSSDS